MSVKTLILDLIDRVRGAPARMAGALTRRRHRPAMIVKAHTTRLAQAGKSFQWYLDTFPDHHVPIVHAVTRADPYLRLEPLTPDQPEIAVNLLLLPRAPVCAR